MSSLACPDSKSKIGSVRSDAEMRPADSQDRQSGTVPGQSLFRFPRPTHWQRRHRGRLQNAGHSTLQTVRHEMVLERRPTDHQPCSSKRASDPSPPGSLSNSESFERVRVELSPCASDLEQVICVMAVTCRETALPVTQRWRVLPTLPGRLPRTARLPRGSRRSAVRQGRPETDWRPERTRRHFDSMWPR